ncbi:DUF6602 domain-containing protein [Leifsonia aquatica]|uniref:DUF6602 domain-containing protein n=1 Tax=Leifsonia aquatica TaxID=144185 RepID=UPI00382D19BE
MGLVERYWDGATRRLQVEADVFNQLISHNGEKGRANEMSVAGFFERVLPEGVGIGTGMVIDHKGNQSKQSDLVIFEKSGHPRLFSQTDTLIHPVDTVLMVIEVKTTLNSDEVAEIGSKARALRALQPTEGRALPSFSVFAFSSATSPRTTISQFETLDEPSKPDSFCVSNPGVIGSRQNGPLIGQMVPLHAVDAEGNKIPNTWQTPPKGHTGNAVEREGSIYPISTVTSRIADPVLFDPGRALLLYAVEVLRDLATRGTLGDAWWNSYLEGTTTETVGVEA